MRTVTPLTIVQGRYLAPLDEVDAHREAHFAFADGLVAGGRLLMAGRRTPPDGSILVFRGDDGEGALDALAADPYVSAGVVAYEVVAVFTPGRYAPELAAALVAG